MAKEFIKLGFMIGVDGPITYSNNVKGIELIKEIPIESILLETDSPYLAPEPNRGKQNSPLNLIYIAEKVADIKGISVDEVIEKTTKNAKELFNI
jgi:TatD DNase family protein